MDSCSGTLDFSLVPFTSSSWLASCGASECIGSSQVSSRCRYLFLSLNLPLRCSFSVNADDADITFKSADDVLFFIHRQNLEMYAGGFPPAEFKSSRDDIVPMVESSLTLDMLFTFMYYPGPLPDMEKLPFEAISDLAEAAEKYEVFSAIAACNEYMMWMLLFEASSQPMLALLSSAAIKDNAIDVLRYAATHHDRELLDAAAPMAIGEPLDSIVRRIPTGAVVAWVCQQSSYPCHFGSD